MNNNLNTLPRPLILMRQNNSYPNYSVLRNNNIHTISSIK